MAEILGSSTCDRFQTGKLIILFLTYCLILYLKSNVKCFKKGRALSNTFWIYQDKIVMACRIEFNPSETIKWFINWSEDSDKKQQQYLRGQGSCSQYPASNTVVTFFLLKRQSITPQSVLLFSCNPSPGFPYCSYLTYWHMAIFNFSRVFYYCF